MSNITLGDRVKDKISGLKGIAIGATNWLYGCRRITVQPEDSKDGKPCDTFCVDEPQLEVLKSAVVVPPSPKQSEPARKHGPRPDTARRQDVNR